MIRLILLGDPVGHSRSPAIHRAALDAVGLAGGYEPRRCSAGELVGYVDQLRVGELDGANVTMPLKVAAAAVADAATTVVGRAGAANTLLRAGGRIVADNTDIGGIGDVWRRRQLPEDAPVLVLGAGGAAAAALVALEGRRLAISARRQQDAVALTDRIGAGATVVPWGSALAAVVVNATPIGMNGEGLPDAVVEEALALFDMAYGPTPTPAVVAMSGRPFADGIDLLVAQAARSFEIWTGHVAPIDVMEDAARG